MNRVILFLGILLSACNGNPKNYQKAENALDAGREFIGACLQGDFSKASYLMVQNEVNIEKLKELQGYYRQKDKEVLLVVKQVDGWLVDLSAGKKIQ
jgi:hypothetical protein